MRIVVPWLTCWVFSEHLRSQVPFWGPWIPFLDPFWIICIHKLSFLGSLAPFLGSHGAKFDHQTLSDGVKCTPDVVSRNVTLCSPWVRFGSTKPSHICQKHPFWSPALTFWCTSHPFGSLGHHFGTLGQHFGARRSFFLHVFTACELCQKSSYKTNVVHPESSLFGALSAPTGSFVRPGLHFRRHRLPFWPELAWLVGRRSWQVLPGKGFVSKGGTCQLFGPAIGS
jgi:hypothetical protein